MNTITNSSNTNFGNMSRLAQKKAFEDARTPREHNQVEKIYAGQQEIKYATIDINGFGYVVFPTPECTCNAEFQFETYNSLAAANKAAVIMNRKLIGHKFSEISRAGLMSNTSAADNAKKEIAETQQQYNEAVRRVGMS